MTRQITTVVAARYPVGECPTWDERRGWLLWTSITEGTIHALDPQSGARHEWRFNSSVGAFGLCDSGRFVVALKDSVIVFDPETGDIEPLAQIEHPIEKMRLNDGKVGPDGAFWIGSLDDRPSKEPIAALYRVSADGKVSTITDGLKVSNGLAWSVDGKTMYHSDSRGPWIDAWDFDLADGAASNRRRIAEPDDATGRPDGGATDLENHYWSAGPSGSRVNRFAPDGSLVDYVDVPTLRPTMPCFGGADMKTVYVTSLSENVSAELLAQHPLCGSIVSFRSDVAGVPVTRFPA